MARTTLRTMLLAGAVALATLPAAAQTLEVAIDGSPAGLDPHIITAFTSFMVVNRTIYEGLTSVDKDLRLQPGIAESWTVAPDGKSYTFKIRSGATFHNGAPVEAADVVASLKRVLGKDIASPLASRLAAVDTITANGSSVEMKLKEPSAPLLTSLATIAIVPRAFETDKDGLQKQPVGTGPFKFKEWQPNGFILLSKHDGYWQKEKPKLDGVKFNIVPESATRQVGISSGQYAMLPNIDAATALQVKGKPGVKLSETLELAYTLVGLNVSKPPFDNAKVREAVNYAVNRDEIVAAALFGAGVPGGPLSPALTDWAVDVEGLPLLQVRPCQGEGAASRNPALRQPTCTVTHVGAARARTCKRHRPGRAAAAQATVGIKVDAEDRPSSASSSRTGATRTSTCSPRTNAGSPDPDDYFYRTFRTGGSTNVFKYSNADIDSLLDKSRATTDSAARKADYATVQKTLACQGPIVHLTYGQLFTAMRQNVQGFEIVANRSLSYLADTSAK
jgi:peptide/nickel transport system substrate-binding protein